MNSLYIHIPFCLSKCLYCSFISYAAQESIHDRYVDALLQEIEKASQEKNGCLTTIFMGGGTPTVLSPENLCRLISTIHRCFSIDRDVEFSIEANPESSDLKMLKSLRHQGVNRISFGVQSFIDEQLERLGRVHTSVMAEKAILSAYEVGFSNINVDLMYALPGQGVGQHRQNLEKAFALPITHVSIYELTIEENTPFAQKLKTGELDLPNDEEIVAMDRVTTRLCEEAGFDRYEISNYAKNGLVCRHNVKYWRNEEYYGMGAAAVSYLDGKRMKNDIDPLAYCRKIEAGGSAVQESEQLSTERSFRESVVIGLRLIEGVSINNLLQRYGIDIIEFYGKTLQKLKRDGLLDWNETHLFLTDYGLRYANRVMAELV